MFQMKKTPDLASAVPAETSRPLRYYEKDGALKSYANKSFLLAFAMIPITLVSLGFALSVRLQPPTVIRIQPDGESTVLGKTAASGKPSAAIAGTDDFLNRAYARRFLVDYLNYTPGNVDERWATSMNMMTRQLRFASLKAIQDGDLRTKIGEDQISSVFHLRMINAVAGEPLTYQIYGVKDVHRMKNGSETTDHYVNEYQIRLAADRRTIANPDGLWVAEYSESPIDGERKNEVLSAPDQESTE